MSCKHENLVVAMYALEVQKEGRTRLTSAARVHCKDCGEDLCASEVPGVEAVVEYLKEHKKDIKTLMDLSCEDFNEQLGIKDEEFAELTHEDYERSLNVCLDYAKRIGKPLTYEERELIKYGFSQALLNKGE